MHYIQIFDVISEFSIFYSFFRVRSEPYAVLLTGEEFIRTKVIGVSKMYRIVGYIRILDAISEDD